MDVFAFTVSLSEKQGGKLIWKEVICLWQHWRDWANVVLECLISACGAGFANFHLTIRPTKARKLAGETAQS